jgi:hypothetical protein
MERVKGRRRGNIRGHQAEDLATIHRREADAAWETLKGARIYKNRTYRKFPCEGCRKVFSYEMAYKQHLEDCSGEFSKS